jgi:hypothetical protein
LWIEEKRVKKAAEQARVLEKRFASDLSTLRQHAEVLQQLAEELKQYRNPDCRSALREICDGIGIQVVGNNAEDVGDDTERLARQLDGLMQRYFTKAQNPTVLLAPEAYALFVRSWSGDIPSPGDFRKALDYISVNPAKFWIVTEVMDDGQRLVMRPHQGFSAFTTKVVKSLPDEAFLTVLSAAKDLELPSAIVKIYLDKACGSGELVRDDSLCGVHYYRNIFHDLFTVDGGRGRSVQPPKRETGPPPAATPAKRAAKRKLTAPPVEPAAHLPAPSPRTSVDPPSEPVIWGVAELAPAMERPPLVGPDGTTRPAGHPETGLPQRLLLPSVIERAASPRRPYATPQGPEAAPARQHPLASTGFGGLIDPPRTAGVQPSKTATAPRQRSDRLRKSGSWASGSTAGERPPK